MKFGKLTVIKPVKTKNSKYTQWLCRCDCGNEAVAYSYKLLAGRVKSCGCLMTNIHPYKALKQENAELKAENERLKEEVIHQKKINQELIIKYVKPYAEPTLNTELFDKNYKLSQTLQEIKAIADARCNECKYGKNGITCKFGDCGEAKLHLITHLITKAEEE